MTPRADIALCSVSAKSCTHHAHCLRAQLPAHPKRQVYCTPNRRGDECYYFIPAIAYSILEFADAINHAGSEAADTERAPLVESGGESTLEADAQQERSDKTNTSATNATPRPASIISRALGPCERLGFVHEPAVVPSASAGLSPEQREQLHAARTLKF